MIERRKESTHLTLPPLADPHSHPVPLLIRLAIHLRGRRADASVEDARWTVLELDAGAELAERCRAWSWMNERGVFTLETIPRVQHVIRPLAVVGEQHEPLGVRVETAGWPEMGGIKL